MSTKEHQELNCWIAEHVMGWNWFRFRMKKKSGRGYHHWQQLCPPGETWYLQPKYEAVKQPQGIGRQDDETDYSSIRYTTDPAAAMEVLKKCFYKIYLLPIARKTNGKFTYGSNTPEVETLELAIALFAKKLFTK